MQSGITTSVLKGCNSPDALEIGYGQDAARQAGCDPRYAGPPGVVVQQADCGQQAVVHGSPAELAGPPSGGFQPPRRK